MAKVLVIEDNADLAFGLRTNLEIEGYEVILAEDGERGLRLARETSPNLIVLDLMLPKVDGYRVLRELRRDGSPIPVLILTARDEEADKVLGLRLGADDYVTKPFGVLELLARVEALLRRTQPPRDRQGGVVTFGAVRVDRRSRSVTRDGAPVSLTPKEYDLLLALCARDGGVVPRADLLEEVWGYDSAVWSRTVDTHIAELRRKLEDEPAKPRHILTIHKVGYRLNAST
ncbi:MAG: response regulator transcription factor [Gemmatimonadales bacterium]